MVENAVAGLQDREMDTAEGSLMTEMVVAEESVARLIDGLSHFFKQFSCLIFV